MEWWIEVFHLIQTHSYSTLIVQKLSNALVRVKPEGHASKRSNCFLNLRQIQINAPGWSFSWAGLGAVAAEDLCWFLALSPGLVKESTIHVDHIGSHVIRDNERLVFVLGQLLDPLEHGGGVPALSGGTEGVGCAHGQESLEVERARYGNSSHREARESFCNSINSRLVGSWGETN